MDRLLFTPTESVVSNIVPASADDQEVAEAARGVDVHMEFLPATAGPEIASSVRDTVAHLVELLVQKASRGEISVREPSPEKNS